MLDMPALRHDLSNHYDLAPNPDLAAKMQAEYARMSRVISPMDWAIHAPYVAAINTLKRERNATILAHNYMTPEIYHGIGDVVGDSLQLAIAATKTDADVIVQCGVHFMAETSKILNPSKIVLMPDMGAGCSLAESITPAGIAEMRARYPGAPVVSYVNTTAAVKAASDICCTSANAAQIVRALDAHTIIMTPDKYLAQNIAHEVPEKKIVWWEGSCIVHEQYTAKDIREFRNWNPGTRIIAHPECPPDVVAEADFSGSTKGILDYVSAERPARAMLVTECSMASNIADAHPDVEFIGPCNMCPYMKKITLEKVLWSLHTMTTQIEVDVDVAANARLAVQRMIDLSAQGPRA